jgi:hypothetical protein
MRAVIYARYSSENQSEHSIVWMPGEYSPEVPIEFSPGDLTA